MITNTNGEERLLNQIGVLPEFAMGWGNGSALGHDLDANSIGCEYRIMSEGSDFSQWKYATV